MTVRFNTWIEADSLEEAWGKLVTLASECEMRKKSFKKEFTATILEDPEEDKKELAPVTIREVKALCEKYVTYKPVNPHGDCPLFHKGCNHADCDCLWLIPANWDVEEIEEKIRGEKE